MSETGAFKPVDDLLEGLVADKNGLPGVVDIVLNREGKIVYERYAGKTSVHPDAPAMSPDSVFWLASCTKFITSVAVMQCVERGLLKLDDPVGQILPEYAHPQILAGYTEDNQVILKPAQHDITLRHLLTHSSGLSYDLFGPELREWASKTGRTVNQQSGTLEGLTYPLLFEPGFGWTYGAGVDWAGQMVERVTNSSSLGEYFEKNIFRPLGLEHLTFRVSSNAEMLQNLVELTLRKPDGILVPGSHIPRDRTAQFHAGGSGMYGTPSDFVRVVAEIVNGGGVLLKPGTVEEMFTPQLKDDQYLREALRKSCAGVGLNISPNFKDPEMKIQHGLSFLINMQSLNTGRPGGSGQYGGAANTFWWADPKTEIAGVIMTQIMPYGDAKVMEVYKLLETCLYKSSD